jgi:hypothetical protein
MIRCFYLVVYCVAVFVSLDVARADNRYQSAVQCRRHGFAPSDTGFLRESSGAYNPFANKQAYTVCPVQWEQNRQAPSGGYYFMFYRDGSNSSGDANQNALGPVMCWVVAADVYGNTFYGATRYSCATVGGCATNSSPAFVSPVGTSTVLLIPGLQVTDWSGYALQCVLPPMSPGVSRLLGYFRIF